LTDGTIRFVRKYKRTERINLSWCSSRDIVSTTSEEAPVVVMHLFN
jgi:hypothetical protein